MSLRPFDTRQMPRRKNCSSPANPHLHRPHRQDDIHPQNGERQAPHRRTPAIVKSELLTGSAIQSCSKPCVKTVSYARITIQTIHTCPACASIQAFSNAYVSSGCLFLSSCSILFSFPAADFLSHTEKNLLLLQTSEHALPASRYALSADKPYIPRSCFYQLSIL